MTSAVVGSATLAPRQESLLTYRVLSFKVEIQIRNILQALLLFLTSTSKYRSAIFCEPLPVRHRRWWVSATPATEACPVAASQAPEPAPARALPPLGLRRRRYY